MLLNPSPLAEHVWMDGDKATRFTRLKGSIAQSLTLAERRLIDNRAEGLKMLARHAGADAQVAILKQSGKRNEDRKLDPSGASSETSLTVFLGYGAALNLSHYNGEPLQTSWFAPSVFATEEEAASAAYLIALKASSRECTIRPQFSGSCILPRSVGMLILYL